jgi:hypothetical protein
MIALSFPLFADHQLVCIHAECWPSGYTSSAINRAPSVSSPTFHLLSHPFTGLLTFLAFTHTTLLGRRCRWFLRRCQDDFLSHPVIRWFHMPWGWSGWRAGSRIDDRRRTGGFPLGFYDGPRRRTTDHDDENHGHAPLSRCRMYAADCAHTSPCLQGFSMHRTACRR